MNQNFTTNLGEYIAQLPLPDSIDHLCGPLPISMTNDILFHILFEANETALRGLLCSLLRLNDTDIRSIQILNPIQYGQTIQTKTFILDLKLLLNNNTCINIEMQVLASKHWTSRSLNYLCRSYEKLHKGEDYTNNQTAIHIGILDFDLFPEQEPEFYATYHLANDVTHQIYTGNFRISVLSLNHADKATEEDRSYHLDDWARFFKATTWEELKMLTKNNAVFTEAVKTVSNATENKYARTMLDAYEEGAKYMRTIKKEHADALAELNAELEQRRTEIVQLDSEIAQRDSEIAQLKAELARLKN